MPKGRWLRVRRRMLEAAAVAALIACLLPVTALARKPIISYVEGGQLKLYDAELGKDLGALPVPVPAMGFRYGMSGNGRYVFYNDANKNLHLLDRAANREVPLPGIDVYMNPAFLTVSNFGLLAFDDNVNGPAVAYNSVTGQFVPTGFAANNGHRQTQLSGTGISLATTCMTNCVVDLGNDTAPFVQNLPARTDTGVPNTNMSDEEDPCINGHGTLAGWQRPNPVKKDIFIFDRSNRTFVGVPGLNDPALDESFCVLDPPGDYIGFQRENDPSLKLYQRSSASLVPVPAKIEPPANSANAIFSEPRCAGRFATDIGSEGRDVIKGTKGADVILGLEGNDKLIGLKGKDTLCGGKGRDKLKGGKGKDKLLGEQGRDTLIGGKGRDKLKGGKGKDKAVQ